MSTTPLSKPYKSSSRASIPSHAHGRELNSETEDLYDKLTERDARIEELEEELQVIRREAAMRSHKIQQLENHLEKAELEIPAVQKHLESKKGELSRTAEDKRRLQLEYDRTVKVLENVTDEIERLKEAEADRGKPTLPLQLNTTFADTPQLHHEELGIAGTHSKAVYELQDGSSGGWSHHRIPCDIDTRISSSFSSDRSVEADRPSPRSAQARGSIAGSDTHESFPEVPVNDCQPLISRLSFQNIQSTSRQPTWSHYITMLTTLLLTTWLLAAFLTSVPVYLFSECLATEYIQPDPQYQLARCHTVEAMCQLYPNPEDQPFYPGAVRSWQQHNMSSLFCPSPPSCPWETQAPLQRSFHEQQQHQWRKAVADRLQVAFLALPEPGWKPQSGSSPSSPSLSTLWLSALVFQQPSVRQPLAESEMLQTQRYTCLRAVHKVEQAAGGQEYLDDNHMAKASNAKALQHRLSQACGMIGHHSRRRRMNVIR